MTETHKSFFIAFSSQSGVGFENGERAKWVLRDEERETLGAAVNSDNNECDSESGAFIFAAQRTSSIIFIQFLKIWIV